MSNKRIVGIDILRVIAIFTIVAVHCKDGFFYFTPLAVPSLVLISFYLNSSVFIYSNKNKLLKMIKRIAIPYIFWYLISLVVLPDSKIWSVNWFFIVIVVLYVLYFVIYLFTDKKISICISFILIILCFCLQYSLINYSFVNSTFSDLSIAVVIGRFCEMIPYASTGLLLAYSNLLNKNYLNRKYIQSICAILIIFFYFFKTMWLAPSGFDYPGLAKYIATISVFVGMYYIENEKLRNISLFLSRPSLGIAMNHQIIKTIIYSFITINNRYIDIIIVYFVCFLFNQFIYLLPFKFTKKLVS